MLPCTAQLLTHVQKIHRLSCRDRCVRQATQPTAEPTKAVPIVLQRASRLAHRFTTLALLLQTRQSRGWLRAARRPMSALAAKPSPDEIEKRRRAKQAQKAANPKKPPPQAPKKRRDPAAEAAALREFGIGASLIDAGANLQSRGSYEDVARQLRRASLAGVAGVVLTGCDIEGSDQGRACCERWAGEGEALQVGFTAGVHPHDASTFDEETLGRLEALASHPLCVALGECGLDYDRMFSPRDVQLDAFRQQCALAQRLDRSLFVHVREREDAPLGAYADAIAILKEAHLAPEKVCVHCFTGATPELALLVAYGCRVGFTGFLGIKKRSGATLEAITALKHELGGRFMLETDAPFMLPDKQYLPNALQKKLGLRGGKNEPTILPAVCRALADALGRNAADIARETTVTSRAFFGFDDGSSSSDDDSEEDRLDDALVLKMQRLASKS